MPPKGNTRQTIIDEFDRELNSVPFNKITVASIVKHIGISRADFYYYFADIFDLLSAYIELSGISCSEFDYTVVGIRYRLSTMLDFIDSHRQALFSIFSSFSLEVHTTVYGSTGFRIHYAVLSSWLKRDSYEATDSTITQYTLLTMSSSKGMLEYYIRFPGTMSKNFILENIISVFLHFYNELKAQASPIAQDSEHRPVNFDA